MAKKEKTLEEIQTKIDALTEKRRSTISQLTKKRDDLAAEQAAKQTALQAAEKSFDAEQVLRLRHELESIGVEQELIGRQIDAEKNRNLIGISEFQDFVESIRAILDEHSDEAFKTAQQYGRWAWDAGHRLQQEEELGNQLIRQLRTEVYPQGPTREWMEKIRVAASIDKNPESPGYMKAHYREEERTRTARNTPSVSCKNLDRIRRLSEAAGLDWYRDPRQG